MTASSDLGAYVWLHNQSRVSEMDVDTCKRRMKQRVPRRLWEALDMWDISLFFLFDQWSGHARHRSDFRELCPECRSGLATVSGLPQRQWESLMLETVVSALAILNLRPGNSLLVVNAHTGLANQLAAQLVGPTGKNVGLTSSDLLDHCRFVTDVFRRSQPALAGSVAAPEFTDCAVEATGQMYDRILAPALLHPEDRQRLTSLLRPGGRMVLMKKSRGDVVSLCLDHDRRRVLSMSDANAARRSSNPSPDRSPALLQLVMERHCEELAVRGFYFFSTPVTARMVAAAFAELQRKWDKVSSPDWDFHSDESLALIVLLGARLARSLVAQVSCTAGALISASVQFLEMSVGAEKSETASPPETVKSNAAAETAYLPIERMFPGADRLTKAALREEATAIMSDILTIRPLSASCSPLTANHRFKLSEALKRWISASGRRPISPVHRSLEEMLMMNTARVVSDVTAVRQLLRSTLAPHILRAPEQFRHWAEDFSSTVLGCVKKLPRGCPNAFCLLYAKDCSLEKPTRFCFAPFFRANNLNSFDRSVLDQMRNEMEVSDDPFELQTTVKALLRSIEVRGGIALHECELRSLQKMDNELLLAEIERLNKVIPDVLFVEPDEFHRFLSSRVHDDAMALMGYLKYYSTEMQYCSLAYKQDADHEVALSSNATSG